jgi:hypothetical protein
MSTVNTTRLQEFATDAFFCGDIGYNNTRLDCCYNHPLDDCNGNVWADPSWFEMGCTSGNCIHDCKNISYLFDYKFIPDSPGVNPGAITPWTTCLNVPNIAGLLKQGVLPPNVSSRVEPYIPLDTSLLDLQRITQSVTSCLTTTCGNARSPARCMDECSSTNLLLNATTPNYIGVNECMFKMCTAGYDAVSFANADIIGIGVSTLFRTASC